ncbi:MAG: efflux RND transporter periplasmic adaptor subunit [Anaerolineae bacterium]|nr:efflux RND transporter periplasmic adaptor subunit [Anaerolineae bacterium]
MTGLITSLKKQKWIKDKRIWIGVGAAAALLAAGISLNARARTAEAGQEPTIQTATVRQGDILISASGAGTVVPAAEIDLGFRSSGTLNELNVAVGSKVKQGDVLARLGNTARLEANVVTAKLNLISAQQAVDEIGLRQAEALQAVTQAQQAVKDGEIALNGLTTPADSSYILEAEANLILAEQVLEQQEQLYRKWKDKPDSVSKAEKMKAYASAVQAYDRAVTVYNWLTGDASDMDIASAEAQLAVYRAELDQALAEYESLTSGTELEKTQLNLELARANLKLAEEDLAGTEIVAPIDGTIMAVFADMYEAVGTSPLITLVNLDSLLIEIYLDETDFDKINLDATVEVIFDSLPDDVFTGKVIQVSPGLQSSNGISTVSSLVRLDEGTPQKALTLPVGSNASVEVTAAQAEDAVLVPVEALREISPGEYAVFVVVDGEPQLRMVKVGLIDLTYAEILDGVSPGEKVSTGIVDTQ